MKTERATIADKKTNSNLVIKGFEKLYNNLSEFKIHMDSLQIRPKKLEEGVFYVLKNEKDKNGEIEVCIPFKTELPLKIIVRHKIDIRITEILKIKITESESKVRFTENWEGLSFFKNLNILSRSKHEISAEIRFYSAILDIEKIIDKALRPILKKQYSPI